MSGNPYEGLLEEFTLEAHERVEAVERSLLALASDHVSGSERSTMWETAARELHTLKGNAGMMGFVNVQEAAHAMEDRLKDTPDDATDLADLLGWLDGIRTMLAGVARSARKASDSPAGAPSPARTASSVRVPFSALDRLIDDLAELVVQRNEVATLLERQTRRASAHSSGSTAATPWKEVAASFQSLCKTLDAVQNRVTRLRMVPLSTLFGSIRRLVHDESAAAGKTISLATSGGDTPLDKSLLEMAHEALGHLVRNAVIHGVESAAVRKRAKKPSEATITVTAALEGDEVAITVRDDGAGVSRASLRQAAAARGIETDGIAEPLTLLFHAGLSTRTDVDLGAGRGVGLCAVDEAVRAHGGRVTVTSEEGCGTEFVLTLPLTVSIVTALMLRVDSEDYALPMQTVVESRRFSGRDGHHINHAGVYAWRDEIIPLVDLGHVFGTAGESRKTGCVVIVDVGGKRRGLLTDRVTGIQGVVVKRLDPIVGSPDGVLGSTVLGNGQAVLILDPTALVALPPFIKEVA